MIFYNRVPFCNWLIKIWHSSDVKVMVMVMLMIMVMLRYVCVAYSMEASEIFLQCIHTIIHASKVFKLNFQTENFQNTDK